jgi:hypothetical protein
MLNAIRRWFKRLRERRAEQAVRRFTAGQARGNLPSKDDGNMFGPSP